MLSALYGLVISLPLGIIAARWRWLYPPVLTGINVIYAVPSLALFIALIPSFGLTDTTVIIALTVFSLCVILPNVVDGLRGGARPPCRRPRPRWATARCAAWSRSSCRSPCP